jgi:hypothetical protein
MSGRGFVSIVVFVAAAVAARAGADEPSAASPAAAQAKDDKKGKKEPKPASPAPRKVFTEEDLKKYSDDPEGKKAKDSAAQAAPAADPAKPEELIPDPALEHGGRVLWANRASDARDRIAEAEGNIANLENKITGLRNDMAPGREMEPFRLQGLQAEITKAMEELEGARKELATARTAQEELFREARLQGVPVGWLREP